MAVIDRANKALIHWGDLCRDLNIDTRTQLLPFGQTFSFLQKDAGHYQSELAGAFKEAVKKDSLQDQQKQQIQLTEVEKEIAIQKAQWREEAKLS